MTNDEYLPEGEYYCQSCRRKTKHEYLPTTSPDWGKSFTYDDVTSDKLAFSGSSKELTCVHCYSVYSD